MTKSQYYSATGIFSTLLALISFSIGTLLLLIFCITHHQLLIEIGVYYTLTAIVVNMVVLFRLLYLLITQKNHQDYYLVKILILLANIPIAFVYLRIVAEIW